MRLAVSSRIARKASVAYNQCHRGRRLASGVLYESCRPRDDPFGITAMRTRPRLKKARKERFGRCSKCGKQYHKHDVRCVTCARVLK